MEAYVFVKNECVPHTRRGREILAAVDAALSASGLRTVMFDTREMPTPDKSVQALLRAWIDEARCHDKVALIVRTDLERVRNNMRAQAKGVNLGAFHDIESAELWLGRRSQRAPSVMTSGAV